MSVNNVYVYCPKLIKLKYEKYSILQLNYLFISSQIMM